MASSSSSSHTFSSGLPCKREAPGEEDDNTLTLSAKCAKIPKLEEKHEFKMEGEPKEPQQHLSREDGKHNTIDSRATRNIAAKPATVISQAKWLGTHRHLQAAVAAIDDRLLFLRICEELEARGIHYHPVQVEQFVGGLILKLTDLSSVVAKYNIDFEDFFDNLAQANIRMNLPDLSQCQLECTFINPPLVQDFGRSEREIQTDKQKQHTWVTIIGNQRPGVPQHSQSQAIAHGIEDRMLSYCHMYAPVRRFSDAYYAHYKNFCKVHAFTYHKLVISYGGEYQDLFFVLSWRSHWQTKVSKYSLCFGQVPRVVKNGLQQQSQQRWNPHLLVSQLLVDRFNRERDLTWLVNYLINTHRSLAIIHSFVRTQMRSTRIAAQVLGIEAAFPAELTSHLTPIDEHCIRLSYGPHSAMEFLLLQDNQVAVRDCSVGPTADASYGGVTLADFWRSFQQQSGSDAEEGEE